MKNISKEDFCINCKFWDSYSQSSNLGKCRRFPPQIWADSEDNGSEFPMTNGGDWCGEYKHIGSDESNN